jgi:hypothetical protein
MTIKKFIAKYELVTGKTFTFDYMNIEDALAKEQDLLTKGFQGDMDAFLASFALHFLVETENGSTGLDTSADAKTYGVNMETAVDTFRFLYT